MVCIERWVCIFSALNWADKSGALEFRVRIKRVVSKVEVIFCVYMYSFERLENCESNTSRMNVVAKLCAK